MLIDQEKRLAYIPFSLDLVEELREWSEPVQIRFRLGDETPEIRTLGEPLKGVYIVPDRDAEPPS